MRPLFKESILLIVFMMVFKSDAVQFHRFQLSLGNTSVPEDVMYDRKEKMAIINVPGNNGLNIPICHASNFHDFERGILALKNIETGKCYVTKTSDNLAEMDQLMKKKYITNIKLLSFKARQTAFAPEDVSAEAGPKIAEFCKDYDTRWIDQVKNAKRVRRRSPQKRKEACWFACDQCLFNVA